MSAEKWQYAYEIREGFVQQMLDMPITPYAKSFDERIPEDEKMKSYPMLVQAQTTFGAAPISIFYDSEDEGIAMPHRISRIQAPEGFLFDVALDVIDRSIDVEKPLVDCSSDEVVLALRDSDYSDYDQNAIYNIWQTLKVLLGEAESTFQVINVIELSESRIAHYLEQTIPHTISISTPSFATPINNLVFQYKSVPIPIYCLCDALFHSLRNSVVHGKRLRFKRCPICKKPFFPTPDNKQYCPYPNTKLNNEACAKFARRERNRLTKANSRDKQTIKDLIERHEKRRDPELEISNIEIRCEEMLAQIEQSTDEPIERYVQFNQWLKSVAKEYRRRYAD